MFPIALDLTRIPVLLVGSGELLQRRRAQLAEAHAAQVTVMDGALPTDADIAAHRVIMVTGLPRQQAERIVAQAHTLGRLVNVEDISELCDFYFTANVRRGDLVIAVSTSGASPTLARVIRDWIGRQFGEEWAQHLRDIYALRQTWKKQGKSMTDVFEHTKRHLAEQGWLNCHPERSEAESKDLRAATNKEERSLGFARDDRKEIA